MTPTVTRFAELFQGRENCYGVYYVEPINGKKAHTAFDKTPDAAWVHHLAGEGPFLGQMPLRQDNTCGFGAIDADDETIDHRALAAAVAALALPLVVCRSKSGGAHLYVFCEPVSGQLMMKKLKQFAAALHLEKNHDDRPIEIFPKQSRTRAEDNKGSWINLPYYHAEATNRYAVTQDGKHLSLDEFLDLAEATRLTAAEFEVAGPRGADPFTDGPPCLKTLHSLGYPDGTRNPGLFNVALYMKLAHEGDWQQRVLDYNAEKMDPPLHPGEVDGILKSLTNRDYVYKCKESPIVSHCQRAACKKERYGIGGFQTARDAALFPELTDLTKIETDPPRWTLSVNGKLVEVDTESLLSLQQFRKSALEKAMVIIPTIKQGEWDDKIRELMAGVTVVSAPADAGVVGQFRALVRQFLETRKFAETRDDIAAGRPFAEAGRVFFRSTDLTKFLVKAGFREYEPSEVFTVLRRTMDARDDKIKVKNTILGVWSVPAPVDEIERLDTAAVKGKAY
jgi:hypothetical protein